MNPCPFLVLPINVFVIHLVGKFAMENCVVVSSAKLIMNTSCHANFGKNNYNLEEKCLRYQT